MPHRKETDTGQQQLKGRKGRAGRACDPGGMGCRTDARRKGGYSERGCCSGREREREREIERERERGRERGSAS